MSYRAGSTHASSSTAAAAASSSSSSAPNPSISTNGTAYASSISRAASPISQHPLNVPSYQRKPPFELDIASLSTTSLAPPLGPHSPNAGVRSRKSASTTPTQSTSPQFTDPDVTRPTLKRLNDTAQSNSKASHSEAVAAAASSSTTSSSPLNTKTLHEWTKPQRVSSQQEREIIVHQLVKTDTIASISLRYGITPQALRSANRLWASDSIHLRKTLSIPLDQCHLPSASTGIERIEREEDGNITVWQREPIPSSSSSSSLDVPARPLTSSRSASSMRDTILSPRARRLQSASAFEPGFTDLDTADLIGIWSSSVQDADLPDQPPSEDLKGKGRLIDDHREDDTSMPIDAVASYLPSTNNPYSVSNSPAPRLISPFVTTPQSSMGDPFDRLDTRASSVASSSAASTTSPPPGHPPPLQKRTLTISRVPNSQLSFFPPSSNSSSARSSLSVDRDQRDSDSRLKPPDSLSSDLGFSSFGRSGKRRTSGPGLSLNGTGKQPMTSLGDAPGMSGSFFGPLAGSLARLGLGSSNLAGTWSSGANSSTSSLGTDSDATTPRLAALAGAASSWARKWDLSYFGGEEEEAAAAAAHFGAGGSIGLRDADSTWSRRSSRPSSSANSGRRKTTPPPPLSRRSSGTASHWAAEPNSESRPVRADHRPDARELFRGSGEPIDTASGIGKLV